MPSSSGGSVERSRKTDISPGMTKVYVGLSGFLVGIKLNSSGIIILN
jgi:hypothetical protein